MLEQCLSNVWAIALGVKQDASARGEIALRCASHIVPFLEYGVTID